jgi:hypothetical protein
MGRDDGIMLRRRLITPAALLAAAAVAMIGAAPVRSTPAFAASAIISVTPATQTVATGATFAVTVTQSFAGETTSAEANVTFDPSIVQLVDAQPGPAYASATLLFGRVEGSDTGDAGQPQTAEEAVAEANQTGVLLNAAAFLVPGSGTAPAGDNAFLVLTMKAVAAAGRSPIRLSNVELLDGQYNNVEVTGTGGEVIVGGPGAAPAGAPTAAPAGATPAPVATVTAGAVQTPSAANTPASGVLGDTKAPSLTKADFAISPATLKVAKEATFTFDVTQLVDGAATSAQAKLSFKKDLLEIVKLEPGAGWKADSKALADAATAANSNGELDVTLSANKAKGPATSGASTVLTVTMKGRAGKEGTSAIKLVSTDITGADGKSAPSTTKNGEVTVGSAGGGSSMVLIIVGVLAAVVIVGGGGAAFAVRRARGS